MIYLGCVFKLFIYSLMSLNIESTTRKRVRGLTMGKGLMKYDACGAKLKVTIDPEIGRPINGDESSKLASHIGIVTRTVLPVPTKWGDIDIEKDLDPSFEHLNIRSTSIFILYFIKAVLKSAAFCFR